MPGLFRRTSAAIATATLAAASFTLTPASATTPAWSGPATIAGGYASQGSSATPDPVGGALLYYPSNGLPTVQRVNTSGTIGAELAVPPFSTLGNYGTPGSVAFLANGGAVVTWQLTTYGTDYMAYLSPTGKWGAPVEAAGLQVAVRTGEVLTSEAGGTGVTVDDWALSSSGSLTHKSGPTSVFSGVPLFSNSHVALDAGGSAEVVTLAYTEANDEEVVYAVSRAATGVWGTPKSLSDATKSVVEMSFAAAPGGHAAVAFETQPTIETPSLSGAVHVPGSGFGAAVPLSSLSTPSGERSDILPLLAAGADGTLAIGITNRIGNGPYGGSYTTSDVVRTVAKTSVTIGAAKAITGTTNKFDIGALGVGDGSVIAGLVEEVDGNAPANASYPSSYNASVTTTAAIVTSTGETLKNLGSVSGLYDGNGGEGCTPCSGTGPPAASVGGVALDKFGTAVAVGQLTPGAGLSWAHRTGKAPAVPVVKITSATAKAAKKSVPLTLSCSKAACKGAVVLGRTSAKKFVPFASATYSIGSGHHQKVSLKLSAAGKSAFKHASPKHPVKTTAYASVKSGKIASKTVKVT